MWPGRIAITVVLLASALCFGLAAVLFLELPNIEPPERYLALGLGLVLLYMGIRLVAAVIWPAKPKDPNAPVAPIEIPPLHQVRGRTSYRDDSAMPRNVMLFIGALFFAVSVDAAREQPMVLVFALVSMGILAGAGVMIWRQIQYGRARLVLDAPARRGDTMRGVITTSGFGWTVADRDFDATVELVAFQTFRSSGQSDSVAAARSYADASATRDGNDMTFRFSTDIPVIDTSDGRFSWNVQLETHSPAYRATFLIDVA